MRVPTLLTCNSHLSITCGTIKLSNGIIYSCAGGNSFFYNFFKKRSCSPPNRLAQTTFLIYIGIQKTFCRDATIIGLETGLLQFLSYHSIPNAIIDNWRWRSQRKRFIFSRALEQIRYVTKRHRHEPRLFCISRNLNKTLKNGVSGLYFSIGIFCAPMELIEI